MTESLFDDELTPAFEPSPRDLLDNLFVIRVSYEIGRDLPVTVVIPLTKSLFDDEVDPRRAFELSLRDLLDNIFVS